MYGSIGLCRSINDPPTSFILKGRPLRVGLVRGLDLDPAKYGMYPRFGVAVPELRAY